jgi:hypothetical protein
MRDRPNSAELLEIARTRLPEELLPALPAENKYSALMVAAAMAIAMREFENGDAAELEERNLLRELLGIDVSGDISLLDLNRQFAAGLHIGKYDSSGPDHEIALRLLRSFTLSKLGESNPKYLANTE